MANKLILFGLNSASVLLDLLEASMQPPIIDDERWIQMNLFSNGTQLIEENLLGSKIEFSIPLLDLSFAERSLNDGRFQFYDILPQEYGITLLIDTENPKETSSILQDWLEWIATHANDTWSIEAWRPRNGKRHYRFSFANHRTAVFFKMVWY